MKHIRFFSTNPLTPRPSFWRGTQVGVWLLTMPIFLLCTACLDEDPRDQLPEEKAYDNATNLYLNTVATLYNYIGGQIDGEGL